MGHQAFSVSHIATVLAFWNNKGTYIQQLKLCIGLQWRDHVHVDLIAATVEEVMHKINFKWHISIFQHFKYSSVCTVCLSAWWILGDFRVDYFGNWMVWVLQNATHKLWLMEVQFSCVKKANLLSISPGKSLALHPTVPLIQTIILTNTHTLTAVHNQEQKQHMLSTHISGMILEDKVSLLGHDVRLCRKPVAHILFCLSTEMRVARWIPLPLLQKSVISGIK